MALIPCIIHRVEYPIYSSELHGLSLTELADQLGIPSKDLADHHLYEAYEKWAGHDFVPDQSWREVKPRIAAHTHSEAVSRRLSRRSNDRPDVSDAAPAFGESGSLTVCRKDP